METLCLFYKLDSGGLLTRAMGPDGGLLCLADVQLLTGGVAVVWEESSVLPSLQTLRHDRCCRA